MRTLDQLRERAEAIQAEYERAYGQLFRDAERRQRLYSNDEHEERVRALRRERAEKLDQVIEEIHELVVEAEQEIATFEGGDPTTLLTDAELAAAAARKEFADDDVWRISEGEIEGKLRAVLAGGDRASIFAYWRAAEGRFEDLGRPVDLRLVLDEMREAVAGPERLARVERARATIRETASVEMLAGNLKSGASTAAGSWLNRRVG
jgi:hypothetical protein